MTYRIRSITLHEVEVSRLAYIEAAPDEAAAVIARQEPELVERHAALGWLRSASTDPRAIAAKLRFQTNLICRRYRVSL